MNPVLLKKVNLDSTATSNPNEGLVRESIRLLGFDDFRDNRVRVATGIYCTHDGGCLWHGKNLDPSYAKLVGTIRSCHRGA